MKTNGQRLEDPGPRHRALRMGWRRSALRALGLVMLAAAQLPMLGGLLLGLCHSTGEHQLRVSYHQGRTDITLHHPAGRAAGLGRGHAHTVLEDFLLRGPADSHPDHRFGFGHDAPLEATASEAEAHAASHPAGVPLAVPCSSRPLVPGCRPAPADLAARRFPEDRGDLPPPGLRRRGTVMRL